MFWEQGKLTDNDADVEPGPENPRPRPGPGGRYSSARGLPDVPKIPSRHTGTPGSDNRTPPRAPGHRRGPNTSGTGSSPPGSPGKLRRPGARATPQRLRNGQTRAARRQNGPHSPQKRSPRAPGALQRDDGSPHHETPHTGHTKGRRPPSPAVPCPKGPVKAYAWSPSVSSKRSGGVAERPRNVFYDAFKTSGQRRSSSTSPRPG